MLKIILMFLLALSLLNVGCSKVSVSCGCKSAACRCGDKCHCCPACHDSCSKDCDCGK